MTTPQSYPCSLTDLQLAIDAAAWASDDRPTMPASAPQAAQNSGRMYTWQGLRLVAVAAATVALLACGVAHASPHTGMAQHEAAERALACDSPTGWIEASDDGWAAVCGDAEGVELTRTTCGAWRTTAGGSASVRTCSTVVSQ